MKIVIILLSILSFTNCASVPSKEKHPFSITKATYKESIKEIIMTINYTSKSDIDFLELFFKDNTSKTIKKDNKSLSGTFKKLKNIDFQLHRDPKKEFGNMIPKKKTKLPFDLKDNEAAISYKDNGTVKYMTIKKIEKE